LKPNIYIQLNVILFLSTINVSGRFLRNVVYESC